MVRIPLSPAASRRPHARRVLGAALVAALAGGALVGCSSTPASPGSGGSPKIQVLLPGASLDFADIWYAKASGEFKKQGVDVDVEIAGPVMATTLTAGKAVIGCQGTTAALNAAAAGRPAKVVYSEAAGISAMALVVAKDSGITSVEDLSGKRIGTVGAGGSSFGAANIYAKYITDHGGAAPTVVPLNDASGLQASLLSGNLDATSINLAVVAGALASGRMTVLADANDPKWRKLGGSHTAAVGCWGLSAGLQKNSDAVSRFVAALRVSDADMQKADSDTIAKQIGGLSEFKDYSEDQVKSLVDSSKPFFTTSEGQITKSVWKESVKSFSEWGLNLKADDPAFTYDQIVDMSYWDKAGDLIK